MERSRSLKTLHTDSTRHSLSQSEILKQSKVQIPMKLGRKHHTSVRGIKKNPIQAEHKIPFDE